MAVYTHVTTEDLMHLAELYGVASIDKALPIAEGVENSNYLLHISKHDGSRFKAILTLFEARVSSIDIPFYMCLKEHLAKADIPCPMPYRADGRVSVKIAGKHAVIVSFMEGASILQPTKFHISEAGATLARMHLAGLNFPMTRPNAMSFTGWYELRARIAKQSITQQTLDTLKIIDEELAYLSSVWDTTLPAGIIHADLFPNNVFFNPDGRLSAVIDFYFACHDVFAYDLAIVANAWCAHSDGTLNRHYYDALIEAYQAVRPLSDDELKALPMLLRAAALRFLLTRQHDMLYPNNDALLIPHNPEEYMRILKAHQK